MRLIRAIKTGLRENGRPREPLLPVGARTEIDPLVIPLFGIRVASVVVDLPRREQQHITRAADKLPIAVFNHPFPANGQVQNIPFHSERSIDVEIEIPLGLNGRQPRHQMGVK